MLHMLKKRYLYIIFSWHFSKFRSEFSSIVICEQHMGSATSKKYNKFKTFPLNKRCTQYSKSFQTFITKYKHILCTALSMLRPGNLIHDCIDSLLPFNKRALQIKCTKKTLITVISGWLNMEIGKHGFVNCFLFPYYW